MNEYLKGYMAAGADYPVSQKPKNPNKRHTAEFYDWCNGYWDGWNRALLETRWGMRK